MTKTLMQRVESLIEEDGGCWIWQGRCHHGVVPQIYTKDGTRNARKEIFEAVHGGVIQGMSVTHTCENRLCVNPEHLAQMTITSLRKLQAQRRTKRAAKLATVTNRERFGKITMEDARAIRMSEESAKVLADRYGLGARRIQKIQANEAWIEHSSPWAGLGAR